MIEEKIENIKRIEEISEILAKEETGFILDKLELENHIPFHKRIGLQRNTKPTPERLRKTIEELGPTFIKFGQIMAQRPDLVPPKYIEELEKLEDSAPQFPYEQAKKIIEEEIGTEHFQNIEQEPLAAASIAQVHRATLKTGEEVVIKIRRPGIEEQIHTDLEIIQYFSTKLEKHFKAAKNAQIERVVNEFSRWTKHELDFKREQENADLFRENLKDEEKIRAPETYPELTTEKVFVMEYIDGIKCTEQEKLKDMKIENEEIAKTITRGVLKQSIRDGFFHADPHPSNFLIEDNGTIVYLDFGMMGKITKRNQNLIGLLLLHAMNEDVEGGIETVRQMAYVEEDANLDELKQILEDKLVKINHNTLRETQVSRELLDLSIEASRQGVHMPSSMVLVGKSMLTMEGIGLTIYPDFRIEEEYKKIAEEIIQDKNNPEEIFKQLAIDLVQNKELLTKLPTKINKKLEPREQKTIIKQPTEENKINNQTVIAGVLIISATILLQNTLNPQNQLILATIIGISGLLLAATS